MTDMEYVLKLTLEDIYILACIVCAGSGILGFIAILIVQLYEQSKIKFHGRKNDA